MRKAQPRRDILPGTLLLIGIVTLFSPLQGQSVADRVAEANRLYQEGKFDQARDKYLDALKQRPEQPELHFNLGDALYKNQDYQKALESFQESLRQASPELQAGAWYNLGNTLFRSGDLQKSLEAFKQSLKLNPSDLDAKRNLEYVLRQIQQQPPQQQKSDDQDQDKQDQQEDPKQEQQQKQQDQEQEQEQRQEDRQEQKSPQQQDQSSAEQKQQQPQPSESDQPETKAEQSAAQNSEQQMSPQEVERILDALKEDPEKFLKRKVVPARVRVKKDW